MCCCEHQAEVASGDNVGTQTRLTGPFPTMGTSQPLPIRIGGFKTERFLIPQAPTPPATRVPELLSPALLLPPCISCCSRTWSSAPEIKLLPFGSFSLFKSQCQMQKSDAGDTFTNVHNKLPAKPMVPLEKEQNNPHPPKLIGLSRRS